jgi:hypothetical protein
MCPHHRTLNLHLVHRSASRRLQEHVPLRDSTRKASAPTLRAVLLLAAGVTLIHAICGRLDGPASELSIALTSGPRRSASVNIQSHIHMSVSCLLRTRDLRFR